MIIVNDENDFNDLPGTSMMIDDDRDNDLICQAPYQEEEQEDEEAVKEQKLREGKKKKSTWGQVIGGIGTKRAYCWNGRTD